MMTEIYALPSKSTSSTSSKTDGCSSTNDSTKNNALCKKRAAEKIDKRKQEKKRALKRL